MNNQIPFFLPPNDNINNQFPSNNQNIELDKIINKLNRLEKTIRILENRIAKLETNNKNNLFNDNISDMYIV